jgi:hypothetical protein
MIDFCFARFDDYGREHILLYPKVKDKISSVVEEKLRALGRKKYSIDDRAFIASIADSTVNVSPIFVYYDTGRPLSYAHTPENHCPFAADLSADYLSWSDIIVYVPVALEVEKLSLLISLI